MPPTPKAAASPPPPEPVPDATTSAAQPNRQGVRRRPAPPPTGVIEMFSTPPALEPSFPEPSFPEPLAPEPAPPEPAPLEPLPPEAPPASPAELMALVREVRRLQAWSPDSPEMRAALAAQVQTAFREAIPSLETLVNSVTEAFTGSGAALEKLIGDAGREASSRARAVDATMKTTEQRALAILTQTTAAVAKLDEWMKAKAAKLERLLNEPWYRRILPSLAAAALCGCTMTLLLTVLRPGWTMTADQRESLLIGESVSRIYRTSPASHQAEMRRINRWRSPETTDTTMAAPRNRP